MKKLIVRTENGLIEGLHGGGFEGGYPSEIEFDWEHMARRGMVVVDIQYRLGILGFLAGSVLSNVYS